MLAILADEKLSEEQIRSPELFLRNGSANRLFLKERLSENRCQIPDDLFRDIYETETIFGPLGDAARARMFLRLMKNFRTGACQRTFWSFIREQADCQQ